MTAHSAVAVAAAHGPGSRTRINRFGLWLFLFSDGLLFAVMATGRFYMAGTDSPEGLAQWLGLLITSILLLSSLTAYRAETGPGGASRSG